MNVILSSRSMFNRMVDRLDLGVRVHGDFAYTEDAGIVYAGIVYAEVTA